MNFALCVSSTGVVNCDFYTLVLFLAALLAVMRHRQNSKMSHPHLSASEKASSRSGSMEKGRWLCAWIVKMRSVRTVLRNVVSRQLRASADAKSSVRVCVVTKYSSPLTLSVNQIKRPSSDCIQSYRSHYFD